MLWDGEKLAIFPTGAVCSCYDALSPSFYLKSIAHGRSLLGPTASKAGLDFNMDWAIQQKLIASEKEGKSLAQKRAPKLPLEFQHVSEYSTSNVHPYT